MLVKRGYKYRFYPTPEQEVLLAQHFGCARKVFNDMLHLRTSAYQKWGISLSNADVQAQLTSMKRDSRFQWLNDVSSVALQQSLNHLEQAFQAFFSKKARYPSFKKKNAKQSYTLMRNAFRIKDGQVTLGKFNTPLDIKWSRELPGDPSQCTVSRDAAGRYFISFLCEVDMPALPASKLAAGIDLGLYDFVVTSDGLRVAAPRFLRTMLRRVRLLSRSLSRKTKGSMNYGKARLKLAKLHAKVSDRRSDFLHKLSTRLVRTYGLLGVESLNVKGMQRSRLSLSIGDAGFGEFVRQLEYKAVEQGRTIHRASPWFASSKTCSGCGHQVSALRLSTRSWACPACGEVHDRDLNAARNLLLDALGSVEGSAWTRGTLAGLGPA